MKLTANEVRRRFQSIVNNTVRTDEAVKQLEKLFEEATGQKLPEPFDESNVKHGSVWLDPHGDPIVLLGDGNDNDQFYAQLGADMFGPGKVSVSLYPPASRSAFIKLLQVEACRYLGQYNFVAGLPKH